MTRISNLPISFALLDSRYVNVTGDTLTGALNAQNLIPVTDSTYDLGSTTKAWANLYVDTIKSITGNALALTPVAGQSLTVNLSTTGDFIVNTDDLVVDTSAGMVGIGNAAPGGMLHITVGAAATIGQIIRGAASQSANLQVWQDGSANNLALIDANGGAVFNETGNPSADFRIEGDTVTSLFYIDASTNEVGIGATPPGSGNRLTVQGGVMTHGTARGTIVIRDTTAMAEGVGGGFIFQGLVNATDYGAFAGFNCYKANGTADDYSGQFHFQTRKTGSTSATRMIIDENGNVIINTAAIATTATNGFLYIPTCAGVPTGTPTSWTGRVPIVYDSTNNKLYLYDGSWIGIALA